MAVTETPGGGAGPRRQGAAAPAPGPALGGPGPGHEHGEGEESLDAGELPLLSGAPGRSRARLGTRRRQIIAFGIIAAALSVLLWQGLGNATVYFKTTDEAVAQRAKLGSHTFRIEGTVQPGVHQVGQDAGFVIANNGVSVDVVHHGSPPQLFKIGIPVVLQGHFAPDGHFASHQILVKHTASYVAKHPDRVKPPGTTVPPPSPPSAR